MLVDYAVYRQALLDNGWELIEQKTPYIFPEVTCDVGHDEPCLAVWSNLGGQMTYAVHLHPSSDALGWLPDGVELAVKPAGTYVETAHAQAISLPIDGCYCDESETAVCPDRLFFEGTMHFTGGYLGDARYNFIPSEDTLRTLPEARSFYGRVTVDKVADVLIFEHEDMEWTATLHRCTPMDRN